MKPIIKYQGGKGREVPFIKELMGEDYDRVIEPFCGGAAVSFAYEKPAVLCDINQDAINLYKVVASSDYTSLLDMVDFAKQMDRDTLEHLFYFCRKVYNNQVKVNSLHRAFAYIIVRQLCFSGMERYNSDGLFNVPFGHYKKIACNLKHEHHFHLAECEIMFADFEDAIEMASERDLLFIDPPYLDRLGYSQGDGGEALHSRLADALERTKATFIIVHSDHEFYRERYKDYNIVTKDFMYRQRFGKDKDHSGAGVQHLYITNKK